MNCTECLKINPLPDCLGEYATMNLTGISFPGNPGDDIVMKIRNTATSQVWYIPFTDGDDIDLSSIYPLMQHYYKIDFHVEGVQVEFTLTNPDATEVSGCCLEFLPMEAYEWDAADWPVSTTNCTTT